MPSTNKTPNYNLNQWTSDDQPTRVDFNADNVKIDAALRAVAGTVPNAPKPMLVGDTYYWFVWDVETGEYVNTDIGAMQPGPQGESGPPNTLVIGTVQGGETADATITGNTPNQTLNLVLPKGDPSTVPGPPGRSIVSIVRTSGTGAPGTTDTYTITYSDETTSTFYVYNGADGEGTGDMLKTVYDPTNKSADAFSMASMVETVTAKIMTGTERTKLAGIEAGAEVNAVTSVAGKTGAVTLAASDVGADPSGAAASAVSTHNSDANAHGSLFAAKQAQIIAEGMLKGDGSGEVSAATAGTDYVAPPAQLTALPASNTPLTPNAEYRVAAAVGTYVFAWPSSPFEVWLKFTTAASTSISFVVGTKYIGGAPTFAGSKTYEMSVKDGVVIAQEVT